jgi:hypothetical protein
MEYQRPLQVAVLLNDTDPEVGQRHQKMVSPAAVGEVAQWQGAHGNVVVKPLPLCILSGTNPTIKMGSIDDEKTKSQHPSSRKFSNQ